jgi:hypothetical protein
VGFMKRPLFTSVIGDKSIEAAGGGATVKKYTPLGIVFCAVPPINDPLCSVLPRSDPVTAIPTHSRRNQRNGSFVRNLFFIGQRPPSSMRKSFQFTQQYTIAYIPCPRINYYRNLCTLCRHFYKGSSTMTSSRTDC